MGLYRVFDAFEANGVIHKTGSSVDVHRLTLCCRGVIQRFSFFWPEGGYLRAFSYTIP